MQIKYVIFAIWCGMIQAQIDNNGGDATFLDTLVKDNNVALDNIPAPIPADAGENAGDENTPAVDGELPVPVAGNNTPAPVEGGVENVPASAEDDNEVDTQAPQVTEPQPSPVEEPTAAPVTEAPVIEAPVTQAPVTQAPVPQAPVTQAPVPQAPVTQAPVPQAPVTQAPVPQAPVTQAPVPQAPVPQAPVTQAPVPQAPVTQAPVAQAPVTQAPVTQAPVAQAPVTQAPVTQAPVTQAPVPQAPVTQAPVPQAPVTQAPVAQAPVTQAPVTQAPVAQAPVTQAPPRQVPVTQPPAPATPAVTPATPIGGGVESLRVANTPAPGVEALTTPNTGAGPTPPENTGGAAPILPPVAGPQNPAGPGIESTGAQPAIVEPAAVLPSATAVVPVEPENGATETEESEQSRNPLEVVDPAETNAEGDNSGGSYMTLVFIVLGVSAFVGAAVLKLRKRANNNRFSGGYQGNQAQDAAATAGRYQSEDVESYVYSDASAYSSTMDGNYSTYDDGASEMESGASEGSFVSNGSFASSVGPSASQVGAYSGVGAKALKAIQAFRPSNTISEGTEDSMYESVISASSAGLSEGSYGQSQVLFGEYEESEFDDDRSSMVSDSTIGPSVSQVGHESFPKYEQPQEMVIEEGDEHSETSSIVEDNTDDEVMSFVSSEDYQSSNASEYEEGTEVSFVSEYSVDDASEFSVDEGSVMDSALPSVISEGISEGSYTSRISEEERETGMSDDFQSVISEDESTVSSMYSDATESRDYSYASSRDFGSSISSLASSMNEIEV